MSLSYSSEPASGMTLVATILATSTMNMTFSGIPQGFRHLKLIGSVRDPSANVTAGLRLNFNDDSGATQYGSNTGWLDNATYNSQVTGDQSYLLVGRILGASITIDVFSTFEVTIPYYNVTDRYKSLTSLWCSPDDSTAAGQLSGFGGGVWKSDSAITKIRVWSDIGAGDFAAGSLISLYGLM